MTYDLAQHLAQITERIKDTADPERDHSVGDDALLAAVKALAANQVPAVKDAAWYLVEVWERESARWWNA